MILQHPFEASNPKGSARLLHLSLPGSRLITGEIFDEAALQAALWGSPDISGHGRWQAVLLYPADFVAPSNGCGAVLIDTPDASAAVVQGDRCLVVLDGTWRQSRAILRGNPLLQTLPRLALQPSAPSRYTVRKAHKPNQLSSLEAACAALSQLEGTPEKFHSLLTAFDGFVAQQLRYRTGHWVD